MNTILVSPVLPTVAGDQHRHPLIGADFWNCIWIENAHIIPDLVDISKFSDALAQTLSLFPTFAGRLQKDSQSPECWVGLTNSPVPVVIETNSPSPQPPLGSAVVLEHLHPFISPLENALLMNNDKPLVTIKLSSRPGSRETVIGLAVSHMIADGHHMLRFTHTLSQIYQGQSPEDPALYYIPEPFPPLESEIEQEAAGPSDSPPFWSTRHLDPVEAQNHYKTDYFASSPVNLCLSPIILGKLKDFIYRAVKALPAQDGNPDLDPETSISRQDAISAYIVATINRFLPKPVTYIITNMNYRGMVPQVNIGTNATTFIQTPLLLSSEQHNIASIALSLRHSILRARKPDQILSDLTFAQKCMLEAISRNRLYVTVPPPDAAIVNGNAQYDWNSPHFGYPGRTRMHTSWLASRYIRIFRSNPRLSTTTAGETVIDDTREGWLDVQFRVEKAFKNAVGSAIEKDMRALESTGDLASE